MAERPPDAKALTEVLTEYGIDAKGHVMWFGFKAGAETFKFETSVGGIMQIIRYLQSVAGKAKDRRIERGHLTDFDMLERQKNYIENVEFQLLSDRQGILLQCTEPTGKVVELQLHKDSIERLRMGLQRALQQLEEKK